MIQLDIFIDPICPWCLLGKANLDRALADHPAHPFTIAWHPFQLNPTMPIEGVDKRSYLERAFGGAARVNAVHERLRETARSEGLDLNPDLPQRIANTLNAHRLIHWAAIEGVQTAMVAALFDAYWMQGRDIGALDVLADIAAGIGMNRAATLRLLRSNADGEDIAARCDDARHKGVTAVPTYLIAKTYVVSGAQAPDVWAGVISEITAKLKVH